MTWILCYCILANLIMLTWFLLDLNVVGNEEAEDAIADLTWNTGIKRTHVRAILYISAALFGWVMLPFEIYNIFVKEN